MDPSDDPTDMADPDSSKSRFIEELASIEDVGSSST